MAVNDSIVSLIDDIVSGLRNNGTIINETFSNNVLTLELTDLYDLSVNKYIEVGGTNYKIIALDSGASTVDVIASGVTGETIYTVPTPFFYNGTMQMINKKIVSNNDNYAKYPAICLVDIFQTERITDPTSPYFAEPRIFIAFLKESLIDYGSDLQNPIINEMQDLSEDFITACQQNPFIGRFDNFTVTRHANFGVFASDRGHISTIIDEQLSGVVVEITLPVYENFEDCNGNILTANKCAPVLIKDSDGNLIETKAAGSTYVVVGASDATVENSDASYTNTVASGGTLVLPDITFTDSDGSSSSVPSVQDITATPCTVYSDAYVRPILIKRTSNFDTYDAGYWLAQGAYDHETSRGIKKIIDQNDVTMLANIAGNENEFGNFERFTNDVGGSVYNGTDGSTVGYTIDHYTGRGWATAIYFNNRNWATAMDYIENTLSIGAYTGWRAPSIDECQQVQSGNGGQFYVPFSSATTIFWLCNSINASTAFICRAGNAVQSATPLFDDFGKSSTSTAVYVRAIRNHYY